MTNEQDETKNNGQRLLITGIAIILLAVVTFVGYNVQQNQVASTAFTHLEAFLSTKNIGTLSQEDATRLGNDYVFNFGELLLNPHGPERLTELDERFENFAYDKERNALFYFCGNTLYVKHEYKNGSTASTGHAGIFHTTMTSVRYDDGNLFVAFTTADASSLKHIRALLENKYELEPNRSYILKVGVNWMLEDASLLYEEVARGRATIVSDTE